MFSLRNELSQGIIKMAGSSVKEVQDPRSIVHVAVGFFVDCVIMTVKVNNQQWPLTSEKTEVSNGTAANNTGTDPGGCSLGGR